MADNEFTLSQLTVLQDMRCQYIAVNLEQLQPSFLIDTALNAWLSVLELRRGQILRLHIGVSFWTGMQDTLEKNRAVKLVAGDIFVDPSCVHDGETLQLLIEKAVTDDDYE